MKQTLLAAVILFLAGTAIYAQQSASSLPTTEQTRQSAQQFINNGKTKSSQFDTFLDDFKTRNTSNDNASYFRRLTYEADQLETKINREGAIINGLLNNGEQASEVRLDRYEHLVKQYKWKLAEMETLVSE